MYNKDNTSKISDLLTILMVFIAILLIHIYMFTNKFTNTDDLLAPIRRHDSGIILGRWAIELLYWIRGEYTCPMVLGFLSVLYLTITTLILVRLFEIESRALIIATGAIVGGFPTLAYSFSYIQGADMFTLGILFAVLAIWLIVRKNNIQNLICGGVCLAISCGLYQTYVTLAIGICMIRVMKDCLDIRNDKGKVVSETKRLFAGGVLGLIIYFVINIVVLSITKNKLSSYRGMNSLFSTMSVYEFGKDIFKCYQAFVDFYFNDMLLHFPIGLKVLQVLLILTGVVLLFLNIKKNNDKVKGLIITFFTLLFPIVVNANNMLMKDYSYVLVNYAYILPVLLSVMVVQFSWNNGIISKPVIKKALIVGFCMLSFWYAVICNIYYLKVDMTYRRTSNLCNRILTRIEQVEGFSSEKKVLLIGTLPNSNYEEATEMFADSILNDTGVGSEYTIFYSNMDYSMNTRKFVSFCDNILGVPFTCASEDDIETVLQSDTIYTMPIWPAEGSVAEIENIIVVNMNYAAKISYTKEGNHIETSATVSKGIELPLYAVYLYLNGEQIDTRWYTEENNYSFDAKEKGEYRVLYFITIPNDNTLQVFSNPIIVE